MTDHGTFTGPMPAQAETVRVSLPCTEHQHAGCEASWCACPCHGEAAAA